MLDCMLLQSFRSVIVAFKLGATSSGFTGDVVGTIRTVSERGMGNHGRLKSRGMTRRVY